MKLLLYIIEDSHDLNWNKNANWNNMEEYNPFQLEALSVQTKLLCCSKIPGGSYLRNSMFILIKIPQCNQGTDVLVRFQKLRNGKLKLLSCSGQSSMQWYLGYFQKLTTWNHTIFQKINFFQQRVKKVLLYSY